MLRKAAYATGAVFILIGLLGFVPGITTKDDMGMPLLLGLFMVGAVHNLIHLLSGAAGLLAANKGERTSKLYFQVMGVVYGLVTVVGFIQKDTVLGLFHVNMADNLLHLLLTLAFLGLGFGVKAARDDRTGVAV